jgi:hypothetical protein
VKFLDANLSALLEPGFYYADGQIDGEVYEYGSFLQSPFGGTPGVALAARVRRAKRNRQIGARNPDAVIAPCVDDHEILRRHMAVDALRAGAAGLVVMVLGYVEFFRQIRVEHWV